MENSKTLKLLRPQFPHSDEVTNIIEIRSAVIHSSVICKETLTFLNASLVGLIGRVFKIVNKALVILPIPL